MMRATNKSGEIHNEIERSNWKNFNKHRNNFDSDSFAQMFGSLELESFLRNSRPVRAFKLELL